MTTAYRLRVNFPASRPKNDGWPSCPWLRDDLAQRKFEHCGVEAGEISTKQFNKQFETFEASFFCALILSETLVPYK